MPIISGVVSLGKTVLHSLCSLTSACLTDTGLLSSLLSMLPDQSHFMTHWGPHKGKTGEKRESKTQVSTFCFLLTALGRGLVGKGILSNDLNISSGIVALREEKKKPLVAVQIHFQDCGTQGHVTLGPHLHHVSWLACA